MAGEFYDGPCSINKEKTSPFWMVSFLGRDGKMHRKSTKVPVAGGVFEGVTLTAKGAEKMAQKRGIQIACREAEKWESQNNVSVRAYFDGFLRRKAPLVCQRTQRNAETACAHFYAYLGSRADAPLRLINRADLKGFIAARREEVRAETVRKDMEALHCAFRDAMDAEVIVKDPSSRQIIPPDRPEEKLKQEAFTLEEVRMMVEKFPAPWSSAVRCSFELYGQRLGDILELNWNQFDWENRVVILDTNKTGRPMWQPMRTRFYEWARTRWEAEGRPQQGLLHPSLLAMGDGASAEFGTLVRAHGIGRLSTFKKGRRQVRNSKTFHSIRATCATLLQCNGVSQGMAMELVGHDSEDVHAVYLRPTAQQLRAAAEAMPEL